MPSFFYLYGGMFWLIENKEQYKNLHESAFKEAFVEIIPHSYNVHPCQNEVCAVYIRPLSSTKGFMLSVDHSEVIPTNIDDIEQLINKFDRIYVRDKKEFLHYFISKGIYDITLHTPTYIQEFTQTHTWFYQRYKNKKDINRIIPIVKHYEYCQKLYNDLKNRINVPINDFYNTKATLVFNAIERSGIHIDKERFESHFHPIDSDYVYTQYNFKTLTTRPSNKFGGINYAALNKKNHCRESFIPRNEIFVELDISAYHPTLLANFVGYNFDNEDIHSAFASMYGVDYKKAKELTFKQLYGGVFEEYQHLEFFKKVQAYTDDLWDTFQYGGYVKCPISGYEFKKSELEDMNPQKLLNYVLQNLETANNVCILWDILKLLRGKNTKLVLYTYDSVLFDFDRDEKDTLKEVLNIFKSYKLNVKISYGDTYDFGE